MKFLSSQDRRSLFCVAFLFILSSVVGANPPTLDGMQTRLDQEMDRLEAEHAQRVLGIREQYVAAVARRGSEYHQRGDQQGVARMRGEIERVQAQDDPRADPLSTLPDLRHLQELLAGQVRVSEQERDRQTREMLENLVRFANDRANQLSESGQMDQAAHWRTWGSGLQQNRLAELPTAVPASTAGAVQQPPGGTQGQAGASKFWQRLQNGEAQHVILYGTSLITQRHTRLPTRLREAINAEIGDDLVRVTERANAGEYSKWGADNVRGQVIRSKPDAVIIEFASNDAVDRFEQSVEQARENWDRMLTQLREEAPETEIFLYVTAPPWDRDSSGRGAHASRRPGVERYFDVVREMAAKHQTFLIDSYWEFKERKDSPGHRQYRSFIGDGHHPSGRGVSEVVLPLMLQTFQHGSSDTIGQPGLHRQP